MRKKAVANGENGKCEIYGRKNPKKGVDHRGRNASLVKADRPT